MRLSLRLSLGHIPLIVSLPANSLDLARAALEAGADALKLHLNVAHRASGTGFGSFREELPALRSIAALARERGAALGIMPGAGPVASALELRELVALGFDFIDIYADHLPARLLHMPGLDLVPALGHPPRLEQAAGLKRTLGACALEASIVPQGGYGKALVASDLLSYRALADASGLPLVVPTQRRIEPADIPSLFSSGMSSLMIGAIVTGKTPDSIASATQLFKSHLHPPCSSIVDGRS